MKKFILVFLFLSAIVFADKAGVLIQYSNSSFISKCVEFQSGDDALRVLRDSGAMVVTKDYGSSLGMALCKIEDTGCSEDNCFCQSDYWGFYYVENGSWLYSPVGVGSYHPRDGDMLGFRWGAFGDGPISKFFSDVCSDNNTQAEISAPDTAVVNDIITVRMSYENGNPIAYESIIVKYPGGRMELLTNESGEASFNASEEGNYTYIFNGYSLEFPKVTNVIESATILVEGHSPRTPPAEPSPSVGLATAELSPEVMGAALLLVLVLLYLVQRVM